MSRFTIKEVKKELEQRYGYDFQSEFWDDDNLLMLEEIVEAVEACNRKQHKTINT